MDEWIPVCTGMTVGGVAGADFYGIVALLMCLVSSHPLLFQLLLYNLGLLASFCLSARHSRERGDPSYSESCSSVLPLRCQCCYWFCSMLWRVRFQTRHPARVDEWILVCTGMTTGGRGGDVLIFYVRRCCWCFLSSFTLLTFSFSLRSVGFFFLSFFSSSSRRRGSIVRRVLWCGISASLPVLLSVSLYVVVCCGECTFKCDIRRAWMNGFPCARE